jgi:hypothetical protein
MVGSYERGNVKVAGIGICMYEYIFVPGMKSK